MLFPAFDVWASEAAPGGGGAADFVSAVSADDGAGVEEAGPRTVRGLNSSAGVAVDLRIVTGDMARGSERLCGFGFSKRRGAADDEWGRDGTGPVVAAGPRNKG